MTLKDFVSQYVCKNTMIRLWVGGADENGDHHVCEFMLCHPECRDGADMEWVLLNGRGWQAAFGNCEVVGLTGILCDRNMDAVNIVIKSEHFLESEEAFDQWFKEKIKDYPEPYHARNNGRCCCEVE